MTAAIIVAAGSGSRMGFDKLLARLGGSPVILHTLQVFQACADIDEIVVVTSGDRVDVIRRLADDVVLTKLRSFVPGGAERHLSVWAGLSALPPDCDLVAVHDGARPLIHPAQISRCVAKARETGAAASARGFGNSETRGRSGPHFRKRGSREPVDHGNPASVRP